jgi:hypothetical protein
MKIDCNVVRDLLPPYSEGMASAASRDLVDAHLSGCASCRAALQELQKEAAQSMTEQTIIPKIKKKLKRKHLLAMAGAALGALALVWLVIFFPFPVQLRPGDIKAARQEFHTTGGGANEDMQPAEPVVTHSVLALLHDRWYRSGYWYDGYAVRDDGSIVVVHLVGKEQPIWNPLSVASYKKQYPERFSAQPYQCVELLDVPIQPDGTPYPAEKIIFRLYSFHYYNTPKMQRLIKAFQGEPETAGGLLDTTGNLHPAIARLCTLVWEGPLPPAAP